MFEVHGSSARVAGDRPWAGSTDLNRELTAPSRAAAPRGDHGGLDHPWPLDPLSYRTRNATHPTAWTPQTATTDRPSAGPRTLWPSPRTPGLARVARSDLDLGH